MKSISFLLFSPFSFCSMAQSEPQDLFIPVNFTNWVSVDYLNCLKTQLPCECEKSGEIFLIDIDTASRYTRFYYGRINQDFSGSDLDAFGERSYHVLNYFSDTIYALKRADTLGTCIFVGDTLIYTDSTKRDTKFVKYDEYDNFPYMFGHVTWLNEQLKIRGYQDLQTLLKTENLECFCNWELNAINLVSNQKQSWILEMQNNELVIYRWLNPPKRKTIGKLVFKKKEIERLKW